MSTEFVILDHASKALKGIKAHTHFLGESVDRVKDKMKEFSHSLLGLGAGLGVSFGLFETGKKIYEMGEFSETAHYRLAALAQSIGMVKPGDMAGGLKASNTLMKDLETTANKLGLNFESLANIFPQLAMQAQGAHVPFRTMKKLFLDLAPAAQLQGMSMETLGESLQEAFSGRTPVLLKQILGQLGMSSQQLIMMSRIGATGNVGAVIQMMQKSLTGKAATGMTKLWSESSMARVERIKNTIAEIYMTVGDIVEVQLDKYFEQIDDWVKKNKTEISRVAKIVGQDIVKGMKDLIKVLGFVHDHWKAILATIIAIKSASTALSVARGIGAISGGIVGLSKTSSLLGLFSSSIAKNVATLGLLAAAAWGAYEVMKAISILKETSDIKKATREEAIASTKHATSSITDYLTRFQKLGMIGAAQKKSLTNLISESGLSKAIKDQMIGTVNMLKVVRSAVGVIIKPEKPPTVKPEQHFYGNIVIHQDFKGDALPDKVILRFQADLEKLAEKQRISNVSPVFGAT